MARDSMILDEVIQFIKQAFEKINPDKTEFRFAAWQVKQLLVWLEDYKQLKSDYIDLDHRLRTANTEIDRLQSVNSWIPCSERMPERDGYYLAHYAFADGRHACDMVYFNVGAPISSSITHWMPLPSLPEVTTDSFSASSMSGGSA